MNTRANARTTSDANPRLRVTVYELIAANKRRSAMLMLCLTVPFTLLAGAVMMKWHSRPVAVVVMVWCLLVAAFGVYRFAEHTVLGSVNAKPADPKKHAHYVNCIEGLAIAAGIPTPKAYIISSPAMNAFSVGRSPRHSAICVTTGLLGKLDRVEIEGVVAHETAHIQCCDTQFATLAAFCLLAIKWMSRIVWRWDIPRSRAFYVYAGLLAALLLTDVVCCIGNGRYFSALASLAGALYLGAMPVYAPLLATCIERGARGERELLADANGALLSRFPKGLAAALEKIRLNPWAPRQLDVPIASLLIVNPTSSQAADTRLAKWGLPVVTRPSVDERIVRLGEM